MADIRIWWMASRSVYGEREATKRAGGARRKEEERDPGIDVRSSSYNVVPTHS